MADFQPVQFFREVQLEAKKVTWPTRKETLVSTGMVLVMVIVSAMFFWFVDSIISAIIRTILGLAA